MQVTETLSEGLKRGFTIVVPAADIEDKRAQRLAELAKTMRLPGFRPGKVPLPVVKSRYGTAVQAEVLEQSVNDATRQVLSDRGLKPAVQPKVDVVSVDEGKDLEFKVEVELMPDIPMPDFAGISLTRLKTEPTEEAIGKALDSIANRARDLVEVAEPRPAVKGEVLTVDFVGKIDGEAFEGGAATDAEIEVGGEGFIPGFTEQLEGIAPGEARTINVSFPEGYGAEKLAGKAATFDITAKALKQPVVPPVDDALATKVGFENLGALREGVTRQMQREYDQVSRLKLKRALLDALAERADFAAPESMVEAEFDAIWRRVEADMKAGRLDADDAGKDEETLKREYRGIAERRVKLGLLLSEIGRTNNIAVSSDEMVRAMRAEAGRYPGQEQQVMEFFRKNPQAAEGLRAPIFEDKVVDFVVELAKVEDKSVSAEELAAESEAPSAA